MDDAQPTDPENRITSRQPLFSDPFRQMAESAPIGLVQARADGSVVWTNEQWRTITGVTHPIPIPGDVVFHLVHPDDRGELIRAFTKSGEELIPFDLSNRLVRPNGDVRYVQSHGTPVVDDQGRLSGFVGMTVDMTDWRELREAQARSEGRYRNLVVRAPAGQVVTGFDGRILEVNSAWASLIGYEPHELIGRQVIDFIDPADHLSLNDPIQDLLANEIEFFEQERRLVHRSGRIVWVSSSVTLERDADGKPLTFFAVAIDISARKAAEDALRRSEARYHKLIDEAPVGQLVSRLDGTLVEVNQAFVDMMGAPREEVMARKPLALVHPEDWEFYKIEVSRLVAGEIDSIDHERRLVRPDGREIWVSGGTSLIREGDEIYLHSVIDDITDRRLAHDALTESENRFRTLTESIPVGVYQANTQGDVTYTNPRLVDVVGSAVPPTTWADAMAPVHPDDLDRVGRGLLQVLREGRSLHARYRVIGDDGHVRWLSNRAAATRDESGEITGIIGSIEDVTELVAAQEQNSRLAEIVESTSDLVGITDGSSQRLIYLNRSARDVFGLVDVDVTAVHSYELYSPESITRYEDEVLPLLRTGAPWTGELEMIDAGGRLIVVWQVITPILRSDGSVHQLSTVGRDVTDRKRVEADLAYQATHDSLTDLPNRALLLDHLELELSRAERESSLVALCFLDLDRFKQVNDTLGHDAGDELLAQAARRISAVVRPADTVARLGGDEFVVLCGDVEDQDHALTIAHRVAAAIDAVPFDLGGTSLTVTASIGIALSSGGEVHPEVILRDADAAMYRAKDLGRARLEIYDESMRKRSAHRLELAEELARSIENGEIVVRFQPGVDFEDGRVTCVEALARWDHPTRGLLAPAEFIALAEDTGLIVNLGLRVLGTACEHGRRWEQRFGMAAPRVHVNLSARQLTASNLPVLVQGVLDGSGLTPSKLCLEITESVLMDDASTVIDTLWQLKAIGVTLAIDDFGTGYSSLSYLRRFPVDVLKVDRSFVANLGPDPEDSTIVAAIVNLANTLELEVIAEGVETIDQLERLRGLGCSLAQGYYFAKPTDAAAVTEMIGTGFTIDR